MHGNNDMTKKTTIKLEIKKNAYVPGLFNEPSSFAKIKLK